MVDLQKDPRGEVAAEADREASPWQRGLGILSDLIADQGADPAGLGYADAQIIAYRGKTPELRQVAASALKLWDESTPESLFQLYLPDILVKELAHYASLQVGIADPRKRWPSPIGVQEYAEIYRLGLPMLAEKTDEISPGFARADVRSVQWRFRYTESLRPTASRKMRSGDITAALMRAGEARNVQLWDYREKINAGRYAFTEQDDARLAKDRELMLFYFERVLLKQWAKDVVSDMMRMLSLEYWLLVQPKSGEDELGAPTGVVDWSKTTFDIVGGSLADERRYPVPVAGGPLEASTPYLHPLTEKAWARAMRIRSRG